MNDRNRRLQRISPTEDAGGDQGELVKWVVALLAGVVMIFSLTTLIESLSTGRVLPGLVAAVGIFLGFVALFWVFTRLQATI